MAVLSTAIINTLEKASAFCVSHKQITKFPHPPPSALLALLELTVGLRGSLNFPRSACAAISRAPLRHVKNSPLLANRQSRNLDPRSHWTSSGCSSSKRLCPKLPRNTTKVDGGRFPAQTEVQCPVASSGLGRGQELQVHSHALLLTCVLGGQRWVDGMSG